MDDTEQTQIFLIPAEAAKFIIFQQNFDTFSTMLESGVFTVRNGSVSLHFDNQGVLQTIQRADYLYSRKHA